MVSGSTPITTRAPCLAAVYPQVRSAGNCGRDLPRRLIAARKRSLAEALPPRRVAGGSWQENRRLDLLRVPSGEPQGPIRRTVTAGADRGVYARGRRGFWSRVIRPIRNSRLVRGAPGGEVMQVDLADTQGVEHLHSLR